MATRREMKVVRLLEPKMCESCRFAQMANVETMDGKVRPMIHCLRLDCDNWDYSSQQPAVSIQPTEGGH